MARGEEIEIFFCLKRGKILAKFPILPETRKFFKKPAWKLVIITVILSEKRQNAGKISNFARHVKVLKKTGMKIGYYYRYFV